MPEPTQRPIRVLVVDDEEANRTFAERVLRQAGYDTAVAADGTEALRVVNDHGPFDLVVGTVRACAVDNINALHLQVEGIRASTPFASDGSTRCGTGPVNIRGAE